MKTVNRLVSAVILAADTMPRDELLDTVLRLETLGYDTAWLTDMYGREIYVTAGWLLAKTSRIRIASGIAHIYGRDTIASIQAGRTLSELSGGRFVQGVGVSHPIAATMRGLEWENPVDKASSYLAAMRGIRYSSNARCMSCFGLQPQSPRAAESFTSSGQLSTID